MKRMYAILFAILVAYGAVWGISWRQPIVISFSGFVDTLVFGVDPAASWHYDPGIDEVIPFVPPSGPHAFFRLNDPMNPFITMLSVDIRRDARVRHIFKGFVGGDIGRARISWDPATIPAGQIRIGIGTETTEPTRWYDMHYNDHLEFDAPDWFWISCRPYSSGADHPPYLAFAYPQNGRRDVPPSAPVVVVLDDDETGVNVHSIQMFVNGVDVTSSIETRRLLSGIQVIYRHPPFEYDSLMNIRVIAADIASFPHYLDTTFSFRTSIPAFSPQWEFPLFFVNITARDTVTKCIYAAGAEGASQFFDSLDVAFPSFPAPEFEVFFKLSDPAYPFITALSRDTRPLDSDNLWVVDFQNPGIVLFASWISQIIPEGTRFYAAVADAESTITLWQNMATTSFMNVPIGKKFFVYKHVIDTVPPRVVASYPSFGAMGVNPWTNIIIALLDDRMGIDTNSISLVVDGVDVTADCEKFIRGDTAFVAYIPDTNFTPDHRIYWRITASDTETPPNTVRYNGFFVVGDFPTPDWLVRVFVRNIPTHTLFSTVAFGADEAGTDGVDPGLDFMAPPPVMTLPRFVMRIPSPTGWDYLVQDIRNVDEDTIIWQLQCSNITRPFVLRWDIVGLPPADQLLWGITFTPGDTPAVWHNLRRTLGIRIDSSCVVFFKYIRYIPPTYCLSGHILLEGATDFSGTEVRILGTDFVDTTNRSGAFEICGIPDSSHIRVRIYHEGYYTKFHDAVVVGDIVLVDTLYLRRYQISGRVHLSDRPIGEWDGTIVTLDGSLTDTTSRNGAFRFNNVPYGEHSLSFVHTGYRDADTTIFLRANAFINVTLQKIIGDLFVRVLLEDGANLWGTRVMILGLDSAITDSSGWVRFRNVPYDTYTVVALRPGYQTVDTLIFFHSRSDTLVLHMMRKRGVIRGFVRVLPPDSPARTLVVLDRAESTYTDARGYYEFTRVLFGEHMLHFRKPLYQPLDTTVRLWEPGTLVVNAHLRKIPLNPPRNLVVLSGYHGRIALRWQPPESTSARLRGYGVIRSTYLPIGGDTIAILPPLTTGFIDRTATGGLRYYFYRVYAIYDEGTSEPTRAVGGYVNDDPTKPDVLVVDFDNGALLADSSRDDEAQVVSGLFSDAGIIPALTSQDEQLDTFELLKYKAVFVITGIRDFNNEKLSDYSIAKLIDYLAAGGRIYWEGADVARDYSTAFDGHFLEFFGISYAADGRLAAFGNVSSLVAQSELWTSPRQFEYFFKSRADHRVDEFDAVGGGIVMLRSQDNPPPITSNIRMVAHSGSIPHTNSAWKTIISSVYLGGIKYINDLSNRWEVLRAAWNYLVGEDIGEAVSEPKLVPEKDEIEISLYPVPFNSVLEIKLLVPENSYAEVFVSDVSGRIVEKIAGKTFTKGLYSFQWVPKDVCSGVYFIVVRSDNGTKIKRALLIK